MAKTGDAIVDWLLDPADPAVRHAALVRLLGRTDDDREVRRARAAAMAAPPISTILDNQSPEGHWATGRMMYNPKYRSTVWQIVFLAQLCADPADERIRRGCEALLRCSQNRDSGGFSASGLRGDRGGAERCMPCLTGNLVRAMRHFGYGDDPRWRRAVDWLARNQLDDGGWSHNDFGHGCFQGSVKPLLALTDIPPRRRTKAVREAVRRAVDFFLMHRLFKRDHHGFDVARRDHLRLRFPHGWQTDVLEMLDAVTAAGVRDDERLGDALDVVMSKREADGRWLLEQTFKATGERGRGGMWCEIEPKGQPSKWVTLRALAVLGRLG